MFVRRFIIFVFSSIEFVFESGLLNPFKRMNIYFYFSKKNKLQTTKKIMGVAKASLCFK
jgi:hypothetical protein